MVVEISCEEVWREISNYLEGKIHAELCARQAERKLAVRGFVTWRRPPRTARLVAVRCADSCQERCVRPQLVGVKVGSFQRGKKSR